MRIIKILTDKDVNNFNRAAPKHEIVMAGFFMVNCPACEAFKPEWDKFVNSCESEEDPNVLIAEIDSNQASRVNFDTSALEGFPTVYRDVKGEEGVVEFKHERTKKALRRFLKEAMAAKGGAKKRTRRSKKKRKKRRKSRRKKKKGGDQSHCVQASENPPTKTEEQGDAYCLEYGEHGKIKCDINTGRCKSAPRPLPAHIRYIDPQDIPSQQAIPPPIPLRRTRNLRSRSDPSSLRQDNSSDPLRPSPLRRRLAFQGLTTRPIPKTQKRITVRIGQPDSATKTEEPNFTIGRFTDAERGAMALFQSSDSDPAASDSDSDVDGGYKKKKKRKTRKKRRKTRKKRRTKRKKH